MRDIYIVNGSGGSGKDTWVSFVNGFVPVYHDSIVSIAKEAAEILGWDGGKTEKDRKFLSDLLDLSAEYNDQPYKDIANFLRDYKNGEFDDVKAIFVDMRDPEDIKRAVDDFGAKTILIKNPNVEKIVSNHADANVEDFNYDFTVVNDGTKEQLKKSALIFAGNELAYALNKRDFEVFIRDYQAMGKIDTFVCSEL